MEEETKTERVKSGARVISEKGRIGVLITRNNLVEGMFNSGKPGCECEIKITG